MTTPSPTEVVAVPSASESSHVHHTFLTPMISGCISGGLVGVAWIIGFIIYFIKRHRRERRARALGYKGHRELLDPPKKKEEFIIPPDPAIVESGLIPGERIYDDPRWKNESPKHARPPLPFNHLDHSGSKVKLSTPTETPPPLPQFSAAPSRIVYVSTAPISRTTTTSSGGETLPLTPITVRKPPPRDL